MHVLIKLAFLFGTAARSFGPAVVYGDWTHHWIFWVGPFTGAFVAFLVYDFTFRPSNEPVSPSSPPSMFSTHLLFIVQHFDFFTQTVDVLTLLL